MSGDERVEQYLSEAQPHSQGEFSWDGLRMAQLLSLYAELDPYRYALHALAAAVAGGATFFDSRVRGASTLLKWDGQAPDLDSLGPQGDTRHAALTLALYAAAKLGRCS